MRDKIYYFAYGSNMDSTQMDERCKDHTFIAKAKLENYKFIINTRGVASIIPKDRSIVYGILWKISDSDECELNHHEGVEYGTYTKKFLNVESFYGKSFKALTYIASNNKLGSPELYYIEKIIDSIKKYDFPQSYIKELKT